MKATYFAKYQDFQNEQTVYWFEVEHSDSTLSGEYGLVDDNGERFLIDCEGYRCSDDFQYTDILDSLVVTEEMINGY